MDDDNEDDDEEDDDDEDIDEEDDDVGFGSTSACSCNLQRFAAGGGAVPRSSALIHEPGGGRSSGHSSTGSDRTQSDTSYK